MGFVKKNIKYIEIISCIIVILATFLPFITVTVSFFGYSSSQSVKFIDFKGDWIIVITLAIVAGVMIFGKTIKNLNINIEKLLRLWWLPLVPLGISTLITIYDAINVNNFVLIYERYTTVSFGIGFYLILLGLIISIAGILYEKFVIEVDTKVNDESIVIASSVISQDQLTQSVEPVVTNQVIEQTQSVESQTQSSTISCPECDSQVPSTSKFCSTCGKQLQ